MKKVNVVTYCDWRSYGSILQALGLQRMLEKLGYEGSIILPEPVPKKCLQPKLPMNGGLRRRVADAHKLLNHRALSRKYRGCNAFIQTHITVKYCDSYEMLQKDPPKAEVYLAGSDQIWHPAILNPLFFLDFVPEGIPKVSYAASLGSTMISAEKEEQMRRYVQRFAYLSVREADNQDIIGKMTEKPVYRHIDPVFLVDQKQWRSLEKEYPNMEKPYILVCAIYWNRALNAELRELHNQTGMDVVVVTSSLRKIYANKWIYDADPAHFLWLLDHAQMVVTSSFHGTAMSIIFQKPFAAVINPEMPSRIAGLLDVLGIGNVTIMDLKQGMQPDYRAVAKRIQEEQIRSEVYLKEALGGK